MRIASTTRFHAAASTASAYTRRGRNWLASPESPPITKPLFVAFHSPTVIVVAESLSDVTHMLTSLAGNEKLHEHWNSLLVGQKWEAPVTVLRRYDRANAADMYSPVNPSRPAGCRVDIDAVVVEVDLSPNLTISIRAIASEPDRAIGYFRDTFFPQDSFAWQVCTSKQGFRATLRPRKELLYRHWAIAVAAAVRREHSDVIYELAMRDWHHCTTHGSPWTWA